jgi:hypothetical protein
MRISDFTCAACASVYEVAESSAEGSPGAGRMRRLRQAFGILGKTTAESISACYSIGTQVQILSCDADPITIDCRVI